MKNKVDIRWFLNKHIEGLEEPFIFNDFTVASSGVSVIFLPVDSQYKKIENKNIENASRTMLKDIDACREHTFVLPDIKIPEPDRCCGCGGTGKVLVEYCDDCEGGGEVAWTWGGHRYCAECKECQGEGEKRSPGIGNICCDCAGLGLATLRPEPARIEKLKINPALLFPIKDIPGLKVSVVKETKGLAFYGEDCKGIILGMRQL